MKKYIVVDEHINGNGDTFEQVFDTAEEANAAASCSWEHLTARERSVRHIFAAVVTEEMLMDGAVDEESAGIDWRMWHSCNDFDGSFDSAKS